MKRFGNVAVVPAYNEQKTIASTIDALWTQTVPLEAIVVVDNDSTDDTANIVEQRQEKYPNLHLVHEDRKGPGYACNAGFEYAIDEINASTVSRIDSDTQAFPNWNEAINKYFDNQPNKQLLTGPSYPLHDAYYKHRDSLLWPLARKGYRVGNIATTHALWPLRVAHGHNLSIRSEAFESVGGFPGTSLEDCLDNIELSKRIYDKFGFKAMGYSMEMKVRTSMRRIRKVGYFGLVLARGNLASSPSYAYALKENQVVDVR